MPTSYAVEFRDQRGEAGIFRGRSEFDQITRGKAAELAAHYVRQHPDRMAHLLMEVEKPNGKTLDGRRRTASRTEAVATFVGKEYRGPRSARPTMERFGRGRSTRSIITA